MRVVILLGGLLCSCGFMNSESRKLPWIHTDAVVVKSQADYAALKRAKDIDVIYKFNFQEGVYLAKNVHSGKNHDFPKLEGFSLAGGKARVWHSLARASLVQDRDLVPPIEGLDGLSYWKTALSLSDKELGRGVKVCVIDNGIHGSVSQGQVNDINLTWGKQPPQSGSHGSVIASIYLSGQENQGDKEKVEFYSIRISFEG